MNNLRGSEWHKWDLHIHTASSYDSPYRGDDADELLCATLHDNNISAVAITDHFKIDADRISHLRSLAPDIVFFPGVELRTDKGADNLHLIIVFSNEIDLSTLSMDFEAIMLRTNAKSNSSPETIYEKIRELYLQKSNLVSVYHEIYAPVEIEIKKLLGELEESIEFAAEIQLEQSDFAETALSLINQKYAGLFKGKSEAYNKMNQLLRRTEFDNVDSVIDFIHDVLVVVDEDLDNSTKKVPDKKALYNLLCCLDYIGVSFKLKMGERDLEELSPGERGIVLLVFYLALSQNNIPIIIDQPEDNLDNQSVYSKLVPCICEAKKKRQVIIVSHNPNIAIACDAEQIVYCHMDKNTHTITYEAGAIENSIVKGHVVDVLEGTMPAFNLRQRKYTQK